METKNVDVAIIGAGTAGMTAYRAAKEHTDNILIIESGKYGTTCARVGCMPSKLLIAAAEISHQIDQSAQFGIDVPGKSINGERVMQRIKSERDRFVGFVEATVDDWPSSHKLIGSAKFISANELQVNEHTRVKAKRIVIANGSRPVVPTPWYELGKCLLVNDDVFEWNTLPASIAVVGTGVVGMEISQALSRLGVKTHLFGIGHQFGPVSDPEVNEEVRRVLVGELTLSSDSVVRSVEKTPDGVTIAFTEDGADQVESYEYLLAATGRKSNIDTLDLPATGISLNKDGFPEFELTTGQIENSTIFLAGDASNSHPLLHEAADDGRIAGDNAGRYPDIKARPRRAPFSIVFTDPQIALVGAQYSALIVSGTSFAVGTARFDDQGRSRVIGKNKGIIRVYGEMSSGIFLGAEMFGPAAEHIGHLLSWSVQHHLTVQQMLDSPFYHPVIEEGVRTALRDLNRNLKMGPAPVERCLDCGPGA